MASADGPSYGSNCLALADDLLANLSAWNAHLYQLSASSQRIHRSELARLNQVLQLSLCMARGLQNTTSPINSLPPEILTHVFKLIPADELDVGAFPHSTRDTGRSNSRPRWRILLWIGLLRVCRYWRQTLLQSPALWSTIIVDGSVPPSQRLLHFFTSRAGSHPLRLYITSGRDYVPTLNTEQAARLQEFRIQCNPYSFIHNLDRPAPLLEYLDISYSYKDALEGALEDLDVDISTIFSDRHPQLRRLVMENFTSWDKNHFHNLTHLCLSGLPFKHYGDARERYTDFMQLLQANRSLEELYLRRLDPWIPHRHDARLKDMSEIVSLDHLRRFALAFCTSVQTAQLLSHLRLPSGLCMSITDVRTKDKGLFSTLPDDLSHLHIFDDITSLEVFADGDPVVNGVGPSGSFHIQLRGPGFFRETVFATLSSLSRSSATAQITDLWISNPQAYSQNSDECPDLYNKESWQSILTPFVTAETLILEDSPALRHMLVALGHREGACRHLQNLWITNAKPPAMDALLECARDREELGLRVPSVGLTLSPHGFGVSPSVDLLKEHVGSFRMPRGRDCDGPQIQLPSYASESIQRNELVYWSCWRKRDYYTY